MKDLYAMYVRCVFELESIGIHPKVVNKLTVNTRAKTRWGQATNRPDGTCAIDISSALLEDDVPDWPLRNTLIHELLHCVEGTTGHGAYWKRLAGKCNRELGTKIQRCSNYSDVIPRERLYGESKYEVTCQKCGQVIGRKKMSKLILQPERYRCGCGGKFKRTK